MPLDEGYVGTHTCYQFTYTYKGISYTQYVSVKTKVTPLEIWFPLPWAHPLLLPTKDTGLPVYRAGDSPECGDQPAFYVDHSEIEFWRGMGGYSLGDEYNAIRRCKCYNYDNADRPDFWKYQDCKSTAGIRCRRQHFRATKSFLDKLKHHALTKERMYLPGLRYMDISSLKRICYSEKEVDRTPPNKRKRGVDGLVQLTIDDAFKPRRRLLKPKRPQIDQAFVLGNYITSYL
jgi:hypothetical protein